MASPTGFESAAGSLDAENGSNFAAATERKAARESTLAQAGAPELGQVEAALAESLRAATAAGEWGVVADLAAELQARREAPKGGRS
jgi:hypothetical protein